MQDGSRGAAPLVAVAGTAPLSDASVQSSTVSLCPCDADGLSRGSEKTSGPRVKSSGLSLPLSQTFPGALGKSINFSELFLAS